MGDNIWQPVSDSLSRLNAITQQLTRLDKDIGTADDGPQLRADMKRLREEGSDVIKKTKTLLTQPYDRSQRPKHDKLQAQLTEVTTQFEKIAKITIERRLSLLTPPPSSASSSNSHQQQSYQQQQLQQQQQQTQAANVDQMLMDERNADIKSLEKELTELGEVFVDVMKLTQEQGEDLKPVQNNVSSAANYTEKGNVDLKKASKYACSYRKKMVILSAIVLAIIVIIIIIAVTVSEKNNRRN